MFQQNSNLYQLIILLEHKIIDGDKQTHVGKTIDLLSPFIKFIEIMNSIFSIL